MLKQAVVHCRGRGGPWREAIVRWQRATEVDPTYALFNNLAIAHQHEGEVRQGARRPDQKALIELVDLFINKNFDLFKEINDRTGRKDSESASAWSPH